MCASEAFTFIKRWVPAPERRSKPRTENAADADAYKRVTTTGQKPMGAAQLVKRAVVGVAAASVAGWLWHRTTRETHSANALHPTQPDNDLQRS